MSDQQKVSFTIRRPTPVSRGISPGDSDSNSTFKAPALPRHLTGLSNDSTPLSSPLSKSTPGSPKPTPPPETPHDYEDSSDEDDEPRDELVTEFDKFGVQRSNGKKGKDGPLIIPALKNKDWREIARKRRGGNQFVPDSGKAGTGADGSVGGLGTRDTINSGPVLSGLQLRKKEETATVQTQDGDVVMQDQVVVEEVEETEDQKALRALLAEASGAQQEGPMIDIIPTPVSESDALKQDIDELPDVATLADYERVPISQFGAAMLRGMGWKEGTAATRKPGKGMIEPYIPAARPALLGIGAKEQEVYDDGSKRKGSKYPSKPERRYIPVVKMEREGSAQRSSRSKSPKRSSAAPSRRGSRSPDRGDGSSKAKDDYSRKRDRERDYSYDKNREDRDHNRDRDRDRERDRRDYGRERDRERDGDRERDRDREHDRDRERDRDRDRDRSHRRRDDSRESSRRRKY